MSRVRATSLLIALGMIWGLTFPLTKIAISTVYQPLGLVFWQLVIVATAAPGVPVNVTDIRSQGTINGVS
jgi:hypothetical protein